MISEFKSASAQDGVNWFQGNAYEYTQGVPYFPLIDLLGRAIDLHDDDSQDTVRKKLAAELNPNIKLQTQRFFKLIAPLFTLANDKAPPIAPESWKVKLKQVLVKMIDRQSQTGLTVICIEDLHWADPSTVDLFRNLERGLNFPRFF